MANQIEIGMEEKKQKGKSTSDLINMLEEVGLVENQWYETIVTTSGPHINAAAIGIRRIDDKFHMKVFEMSNTFENLQNGQEQEIPCRFAINLIDSSQLDLLCYAALRGWGSPIPEFPRESFEIVDDAPVMKDAFASIICETNESRIEDVKDNYGRSTRMDVRARIVDVILNDPGDARPIARSPDEPLVEALIFATKFKIAKGAMKDKLRSRVEELLEQAGRPHDVAHSLTIEALKEYFGIWD
jgi:hypothetical protein